MIATILTVFQYARAYFSQEDFQVKIWAEFVQLDELIKEIRNLRGDRPRTNILGDHIRELERKRDELGAKIQWWD